jgi:thymidine kinase
LTNFAPVICYGLKTDYRTKLFPGSQRLLEIADSIEEIKTICVVCNKKSIINSKFQVQNNKKIIIRDGSELPDIGAEEKYQSMCWWCWNGYP